MTDNVIHFSRITDLTLEEVMRECMRRDDVTTDEMYLVMMHWFGEMQKLNLPKEERRALKAYKKHVRRAAGFDKVSAEGRAVLARRIKLLSRGDAQ
jgi:hypothetical protein